MGADGLGPWAPLTLGETLDVFDGYGGRWWIAGGRALELFVRDTWRDHDDTDVGVLRQDARMAWQIFETWDPHVAACGQLTRWDGSHLLTEREQNNVWCRRHSAGPWCLDLTIGDGDSEDWVYRRDQTVRVTWGEAVLWSSEGTPYLAPELQMLFKSEDVRPQGRHGREACIAGPQQGPANVASSPLARWSHVAKVIAMTLWRPMTVARHHARPEDSFEPTPPGEELGGRSRRQSGGATPAPSCRSNWWLRPSE
jgi:hypothetical protein